MGAEDFSEVRFGKRRNELVRGCVTLCKVTASNQATLPMEKGGRSRYIAGSEGMSEPKGEGTSNLPLSWVSDVKVRVGNRR